MTSAGRPRRVYVLIASLVALGAVVAACLLVWAWIPTLPDPIATHWGIGTSPNSFQSPQGFALTLGLIMGAVIVVMGGIGVSAAYSRFGAQMTGATTIFLGAMTLLLVVVSVGPQRGLADAHDATFSGAGLAIVLAGSAAAGVVAALLAPKGAPIADAVSAPPADAPRADLSPGADFLWVGKTSVHPGLLWGLTIVFVLLFGGVAVGAGIWWMTLFGLLPTALLLCMSPFKVRITPAGLAARSPIGWPQKTITAAQINQVTVVEVKPLTEFGGWGYRLAMDGTEGVVLRKGPGIRIQYGADSALVLTLNEGAEEAAALLNTAADRTR